MPDIDIFKIDDKIQKLKNSEVLLEKELQNLIENNLETFFGVRFLASEYKITNGRMDSLGIDENNSPVIFEYKRSINENVINQGLFYLDWLLDHKADFVMLVMKTLGYEAAQHIDWSVPSVICIAADFTKYDLHAVNQMQRNIKLVKYSKYGEDLILFEHLNAPAFVVEEDRESTKINKSGEYKSHVDKLKIVPERIKVLYDSICSFIESLGDDIVPNQLKYYLAYKKVQNVVCVEIYMARILLHLKLDPKEIELESGFTRDMTNVGHFGTGDLQVIIESKEDFEKAKALIEKAYNEG